MIRTTVSGSFHRHMVEIGIAVDAFHAIGVEVLSPSDPRVVDADGDFLFVASDKLRSRRLVEDRHLEAIRASDFLWVVCPDGYTGPSTSGEILAAHVLGKPVFSTQPALDITIGDYVQRVDTMAEAVCKASRIKAAMAGACRGSASVLLEPDSLFDMANEMGDLRDFLQVRRGDGRADAERKLFEVRRSVASGLGILQLN